MKRFCFVLLAAVFVLGVRMLQAQDVFVSPNGNWNVPGNWSQGILPGTNSAAIGTNTVIAIATVTDSQTCSNLYVGGNATLAGNGTLNINGGSLLVTGTLNVAYTGGSMSSGTITQTSGSMTTLGSAYLTYGAGSTGVWTVAGGTVVNMGSLRMGYFGGTPTLVVSGGVMSNASGIVLGYSSGKTPSTVIVTNTGVLYLSNVGSASGLSCGNGGGTTNTVSQSSGTVIIAYNIRMGSVPGGSTAWMMTGGVLTNTGTLSLAYAGGSGNIGGTDTWTMTGGVWSNQGLITVSLAGNGTMNMNGGTLFAQGGSVAPQQQQRQAVAWPWWHRPVV